jgi:hypothetical protein
MKSTHFPLFATALFFTALITENGSGCGKSGIRGHIYEITGNQMPSPDIPPSQPKGIRSTLYIYELTNINQVSRQDQSAFYKSVSTKIVTEVESKDDGSYEIQLHPGWYSLFVKKGDLFYSSQFDGKNNIHPVEVKKGEMTKDEFRINYNAVY